MAMPGAAGGGRGSSSYASAMGLDRLIRKEVALGAIREREVTDEHIGLRQIAPFLDVESDDVIFDYIKNDSQTGLAPARAEDAEAELAQGDILTHGQGRASVIDWSLKHRYSPSDVTRYRDNLLLQQAAQGAGIQLNLNNPGNMVADFNAKVARDEASRRKRLDNRLEWLIMGALENNGITYNDGKIKFNTVFNRPSDQHNILATAFKSVQMYHQGPDFDPIGDFIAMNDLMYARYGIRMKRAITSQRVMDLFWNSSRFLAMLVPVVGGTPNVPLDPNYLANGWTPQAAVNKIEQATGIRFQAYDAQYRTRAVGTQSVVGTRFTSDHKIFFLPDEADLGEIDDTRLGFAKTLTSPHPEGNWTPGFYEWEEETRDPWQHVRGTGVKAFPVFPYMNRTFTMHVANAPIVV